MPAEIVPVKAIDPLEIARILRRHIRLIVLAPLVLLLAAAAYVTTATPLYTATSTVFIDPRRAEVTDAGKPVLSNFNTDDSTIESQVLLIQSAAVMRQVVETLNLTQDPEFVPERGLLDWLRGLISQGGGSPAAADPNAALKARAVAALQRRLRVVRQRGTFLVEINAASRDPAKAATIANAVADAYFVEQVRSRTDATRIAGSWLNRQIEELKARVMASDKAVQDFRSANNLIVAQGVTVNDQQITDLNNRLVEARVKAAEARAQYQQVQEIAKSGGDPGSLAEALSSEVIARLRTQYADLAKSGAELSSRYGPAHPLMASLQAQTRDTQRLIDAEIRRILQSRRHIHEVAAAREAALQKSLDELQGVSTQSGQAQVRLRELMREAEANRALYESFLVRYRETSAQESLEMPESRVVSRAEAPLQPSFPRTGLTLGLAVLLGLGLGCVLALIADYLDRRVKSPEQARSASGLPGLAAIPAVGLRELARLAKRGRNELEHYDPHKVRLLPAALQPPLLRYAVDRPTSLFAEAVRAIRLAIQRAGRVRPMQVVMVTSAIDSEGKTTLASNLAMSFAVAGIRTALVDADLRNHEITRAFCTRPQFGLVEVAAGDAPLHQAIAVEPSTKLAILPAPQPQDDTALAEFASSAGMSAVLERLRGSFDVIVIDAPPLLPLVDGRALAEHADCILLAIGFDRTPRDAVARAVEMLGPVHERVLGTVLTCVDLNRLRFYDVVDTAAYAGGYGSTARPVHGTVG